MGTHDRLTGRSILIVDDDKDTREMLRFILEQDGANVLAAGSVPEAVESYKGGKPDIVIADIGMPEFNSIRDDEDNPPPIGRPFLQDFGGFVESVK